MFIFLALLLTPTIWATSYSCKPQYDSMGIAHTNTRSMPELYYCFGFLHGSDRGWEMDFFRRVGLGRNAEVLGYTHLKSDLMMRLLNMEAKAKALWESFPEDKKITLRSYAQGVNEGFKIGKNAHEFKDRGFEPQAWLPEHSLLVLLIQSFDQTRKTFYRDYEEEKLKETWGDKAAQLFEEDDVPWLNTILKEGEYPQAQMAATHENTKKFPTSKLWANFPKPFGDESGSNNWVVSSKKSKTGNAILANDPHLDLKTPMFWYWTHLKSPEGEVIGASVPGVPVVVSGTNGKVAWGLTNAYINAADAIVIKDLKEDDLMSVRPMVWIKFGFLKVPFFFKSFEKTKSGLPILPLEVEKDLKLVLRWTGFSLTAAEVIPMFNMLRVSNVTEMNQVLTEVAVPTWNFVFADTKGDIGFRVVGKSYLNKQKSPFGMLEKTLSEISQEEYLPAIDRPHVLKPKRNYVYTANNRHWPKDAGFYGGRAYSESFRGFRIDELIQGPQDTESFKKIQCDQQAVDARFFLKKILSHIEIPELKEWNLVAEDSSKAAPIFRRLMDLMMENWRVNEYALFKLLDQMTPKLKSELEGFYQTAKKETYGRTWGEMRLVAFVHQAKNTDWVFSPEISGVGDKHSVNPGSSKWNEERGLYEQYSGASMRMIIELKPRPEIQLALPGVNRDYSEALKAGSTAWQSWKGCDYQKIEF